MNLFKNQKRIIAEIHAEFDTAEDRLLMQAKAILSALNITAESTIEQRAERLKRVGFSGTPTVELAERLAVKRNKDKAIIVKNQQEADIICHYKQNYPFLKFLTVAELDRICGKYGLIYANVSSYRKEVPDKNLQDIENAQKLDPKDVTPDLLIIKWSMVKWHIAEGAKMYMTPKETSTWENPVVIPDKVGSPDIHCKIYLEKKYNPSKGIAFESFTVTKEDRSGLFIAAPPSHFDLKGKKKNGLGFFDVTIREIKDPIVFRYVNGGVQILTKWGLEAEDPALFVDKLN